MTAIIPIQLQDIGRPLSNFATNLDIAQAALLALFQQDYRDQTPLARQVRTTAGTELLIRIHPFVTAAQAVEGTVVTFIDMTEQNEMQTRLQHYMDELEQSNAMLEQFARVASHDLRAPLSIRTRGWRSPGERRSATVVLYSFRKRRAKSGRGS